jgi:hypothetical protein
MANKRSGLAKKFAVNIRGFNASIRGQDIGPRDNQTAFAN